MDCKVTESVVFHCMDWIYNSISSWIITTAIDFNPYRDALFSIIGYSNSFHYSDPRYTLILNMRVDDINSVLHGISSTKIEAPNLIDHIHKPRNLRTKRSLLPFGGLFNFLSGTANGDDVK